MDISRFGFEFNGKEISPSTYGPDYISELCRVLDAYHPNEVRSILEWGSGLTTQVFADYGSRNWGTDLFVTIDENAAYQSCIFAGRTRPKFLLEKVLPQVGPGLNQQDPQLSYSTFPLILGTRFDVIFIDGRRRMECAFVAAIMCRPETIIILHDYRRSRYQPVLALFDLIEDGSQFRVMRLRPNVVAALAPGAEYVRGFMHCLATNKISIE
jgi:hypothetical protein